MDVDGGWREYVARSNRKCHGPNVLEPRRDNGEVAGGAGSETHPKELANHKKRDSEEETEETIAELLAEKGRHKGHTETNECHHGCNNGN